MFHVRFFWLGQILCRIPTESASKIHGLYKCSSGFFHIFFCGLALFQWDNLRLGCPRRNPIGFWVKEWMGNGFHADCRIHIDVHVKILTLGYVHTMHVCFEFLILHWKAANKHSLMHGIGFRKHHPHKKSHADLREFSACPICLDSLCKG